MFFVFIISPCTVFVHGPGPGPSAGSEPGHCFKYEGIITDLLVLSIKYMSQIF